MRAVGDIRAPACVKVGTPCFSHRDLDSLKSLRGGNQIAGGLVGLTSCTFVGTFISRFLVLANEAFDYGSFRGTGRRRRI